MFDRGEQRRIPCDVVLQVNRALVGAVACAVLALGACGGDDDSPSAQTEAATAALGVLPEPPSQTPPPYVPSTPPIATVDGDENGDDEGDEALEPIDAPVGDDVDDNRLLLIGDSAMATLTERHDGLACTVLANVGWAVDVEAEMARYLPFANDVIDELVIDAVPRPDVVGIMLGHFIDTSVDEFGDELDRIIGRLGGVPILLYTVAENGDETASELNDAIRARGDEHPNVIVIDWGEAVASEEIADLVDDEGLPTTEGMGRIVLLTAAALGDAPFGSIGECIEPEFTDDSAIVIDS